MQTLNAISDPLIRSAYSPKLKITLSFTGPGLTKQSHKAECDINQILARYLKTGVIDFQQRREPQYGDVTGIEFQEAQFIVARGMSLFAELPAQLRDRFHNSPQEFLSFVQDDANRVEAEKLGLLNPKAPEASPVLVRVQPEAKQEGDKGAKAPTEGAAKPAPDQLPT